MTSNDAVEFTVDIARNLAGKHLAESARSVDILEDGRVDVDVPLRVYDDEGGDLTGTLRVFVRVYSDGRCVTLGVISS